MPTALSDSTIAIVKATAPALAAHGLAITQRMYERMFRNAAIRALFNQSHHGAAGSQPKALAAAILAYAQNIDRLEVLASAVERIAQKHVGLNILAEHYPHVAEALLGAIQDVLGDAATPEILAAWGEAYWFLAEILINRERQIYDAQAAAPGGWNGWRDFRIEQRARESDVITSFVLRPADGGGVLQHRPGQHLTFRLDIPGHGPLKRNYSISSAPDEHRYRISVKREPGGIASNWLHDKAEPGTVLSVAAPAGDFALGDAPERPVVLLSGGVGLTPMVSMLEAIAARHPRLRAQFVHGALDGATHAMGARIREIAAGSGGAISAHVFYERPRAEDRRGRDHDEAGLIDLDWLRRHTPLAEADYYLCGPKPFMRSFVRGLAEGGVPTERIRYEFFGPADELLAA
ncbi:NO-inducible flavohemoprotein [Plastoroseomonas hellenica]|uniref:NO-inducible flavohemoprotein n=1 Tax=Plastoroseomonas hellenica TaxID=2687306 RepID=UPI001BAA76EB|nr:NO-inducible flavohemoprotein [Plastoroseomonas hellenica]MBR0644737.1 NO-inducible flavohemoprotein [Plastoroseomonas hellenica]